jgi:uncharacterized protein YhaN
MSSVWRKPAIHVLFYACGSALVFGSWFASNVVGNHWLGELQDRERVLTSATLTELNRAQWLREYNAQVEAKRSRDLIGLAAYHLLAETEQALTGVETLLEDDSRVRQRIVDDKNVRVARAEAMLKKEDFESVVQALNEATGRYESTIVPTTQNAMSRWETARMSQQAANHAFIALYIAGAMLIACGFVTKELRGPSNNALQPTAPKKRRG